MFYHYTLMKVVMLWEKKIKYIDEIKLNLVNFNRFYKFWLFLAEAWLVLSVMSGEADVF